MDLKPFRVEADIMWAFLDTRNTMSGKYQVDLCNLDAEAIKSFENAGIPVRKKDGKGFFVTAKSTNFEITTVDENEQPIKCKVGNGSRGEALIKPYPYNKNGKSGVGAGINRLTVKKLIEYLPGAPAKDEVL